MLLLLSILPSIIALATFAQTAHLIRCAIHNDRRMIAQTMKRQGYSVGTIASIMKVDRQQVNIYLGFPR